MPLIKRIPFKALGIFIIGIILGLWLGAKGAVKVVADIFETESVSRAINKPTHENKTTIEFNDNKFKKTDSINILLTQDPKTKQVIKQIGLDSCKLLREKIRGFTKSQKRRFDKW